MNAYKRRATVGPGDLRKLPSVRCPRGDHRLATVAQKEGAGFVVQTQPVPMVSGNTQFIFDDPNAGFDKGHFGPPPVNWPDGPPLVDSTSIPRGPGQEQHLSYSGPLTTDQGRITWCEHGTFGIRDADLQKAIRRGQRQAPCVPVTIGRTEPVE